MLCVHVEGKHFPNPGYGGEGPCGLGGEGQGKRNPRQTSRTAAETGLLCPQGIPLRGPGLLASLPWGLQPARQRGRQEKEETLGIRKPSRHQVRTAAQAWDRAVCSPEVLVLLSFLWETPRSTLPAPLRKSVGTGQRSAGLACPQVGDKAEMETRSLLRAQGPEHSVDPQGQQERIGTRSVTHVGLTGLLLHLKSLGMGLGMTCYSCRPREGSLSPASHVPLNVAFSKDYSVRYRIPSSYQSRKDEILCRYKLKDNSVYGKQSPWCLHVTHAPSPRAASPRAALPQPPGLRSPAVPSLWTW